MVVALTRFHITCEQNYVCMIAARVEKPPSPVFYMHEIEAAVSARVMLGVHSCAFLESSHGYHVRCFIPVGACFLSPGKFSIW